MKGDVVVEGETYKEVDVEECTWQIDRGSGDGGGRRDGSGGGENGEEVSNGDQNQDADKDDEGKTKIWVTLKKKWIAQMSCCRKKYLACRRNWMLKMCR